MVANHKKENASKLVLIFIEVCFFFFGRRLPVRAALSLALLE